MKRGKSGKGEKRGEKGGRDRKGEEWGEKRQRRWEKRVKKEG